MQSDLDAAARIEEINTTIIELLYTEMKKIKTLMAYVSSSLDLVCEIMTKIAMASECSGCSASFLGRYSSLLKLLDVLFKLDSMKDMRGSMKSDFSRYKRAIGSHNSRSNAGVLEEIMEIQLFLSNHDPHKSKNCTLLTLRDRLKTIRGYERIFTEILELILNNLENGVYVTPDERFGLIRLVPHIMVIIDGDLSDLKSINVFTFKKLNLSSIQKVLRRYPVVPLYGDMSITLYYILERAQHFNRLTLGDTYGFDFSVGGKGTEIESNADYDLTVNWLKMRNDFSRFTVQFSMFLNQLARSKHDKIIDHMDSLLSNSPVGQSILATAKIASDLSLKGLELLSNMKVQVLLVMSWKYTHPNFAKPGDKIEKNTDSIFRLRDKEITSRIPGAGPGSDGETLGIEYEQAIQRNFSDVELMALIDIISLIKSLSSMLSKSHVKLAGLYRVHQHHRIQEVTRGDMMPLMHRVDKRKKMHLLAPLLQIKQLVADYSDHTGDNTQKEGDEDYKQYSRKIGAVVVTHKIRPVSIGASRMYLLRSKIHEIYDERSLYRQKNGLLAKTDLEKEDILLFQSFYKESYYFPYLLNFSNVLCESSSLWELWHREFHLELTKCVQFPIELSLPWILTEKVTSINNQNQIRNQNQNQNQGQGNIHNHLTDMNLTNISLLENVFFMLDLYNDAAHQAVHTLHEQHLFDEIKAETTLVLEQTIITLAEEIYSYYKDCSASGLLEKPFKNKLEDIKGSLFLTVGIQRYESLMTQRDISILGKSINLSSTFVKHIVQRIRRDIETAIQRFERGDACCIVELNMLLNIIRHTHKSISSIIEIDEYEFIYGDANEELLADQNGRIILYLLKTIESDIIPQFSYNSYTQRFVRVIEKLPLPGVLDKNPIKSGAISNAYGALCCKAFDTLGKASKGFFGIQHIESIICLTGHTKNESGIFLIIEKCLNSLSDKLHDAHDYMGALRAGIPHFRPPPFSLHVAGCVEYYEEKLSPLLEFEDLKPELFQVFREIGNTLLLLRDISDVLSTYHSLSVRTMGSENQGPFENLIDNVKYPTLGYAYSHFIEKLKSSTQGQGQERCCSLFQIVLEHIQITLQQVQLFTGWTDNTELVNTDHIGRSTLDLPPEGFHVMWSAVSFLFCHQGNQKISDIERFGDGFTTAGCVLLHYLGERAVFELNDYSHYILRVHEHDCQSAAYDQSISQIGINVIKKSDVYRSTSAGTKNMITVAADCYKLQQSVFDMLDAQWNFNDKILSTQSSSNKKLYL